MTERPRDDERRRAAAADEEDEQLAEPGEMVPPFASIRTWQPHEPTGPARKARRVGGATPRDEAALTSIDTTVAHSARMYDYLLGGTANFEVDRQAIHHILAGYPGGLDAARAAARANRAFLTRVVRWLAVDAGIDQFLDIGTGVPAQDNVHEVAQRHVPRARVVYVDNDPIVLAHAHMLLQGADDGVTDYIHGDFREPDQLLATVGAVLDLDQPVALMLVGLLHLVPDAAEPAAIVERLVGALVPGSYVVMSHLTTDRWPDDMARVSQRLHEAMRPGNRPTFRSRAELTRLFGDLELVDPGVVEVDQWGVDHPAPASGGREFPISAGVARKP